ncbi:MAG: pitrilysin family protein, partial [Planctomycetota bacterium]|nr:pitrilysin family protein [Planctomycetota bacterium]
MTTRLYRFGQSLAIIGVLLVAALAAGEARAAAIEFTQETLENGLQVIYAPLHQAPVVHVRVLYHVGSRDERPDRQGFAHMFEHMMFRGSAHVKPEEHMKLVGMVGGMSNAFTSFDQTVYVNTIPSNQLELALYLEADRMASFKVSDEIYQTERKVVTEEWRMKQNRPYGNVWEDFMKAAFQKSSYRWTPIGNMDNLRAAQATELQDFFNRYYVPNNAALVIAGDIDVPAAKALVQKY